MQIFVTGTDTNVGKTMASAWMCLHGGLSYFKPVQTGSIDGNDSDTVRALSGVRTYPEIFTYPDPLSPHLAAARAGKRIDPDRIVLPQNDNLIVEGAGGVLVPLDDDFLMIDLIKKLALPTIVVARSSLGTINHTLLTLEALRARRINVLGVIVNGQPSPDACRSIEVFGKTSVLAQIPLLPVIDKEGLAAVEPGNILQGLFG